MGRIKTQRIKSAGNRIHERFGEKFTTDFEKNKIVVSEVAEIRSKKLRNILAGYMTRLKRQEA